MLRIILVCVTHLEPACVGLRAIPASTFLPDRFLFSHLGSHLATGKPKSMETQSRTVLYRLIVLSILIISISAQLRNRSGN